MGERSGRRWRPAFAVVVALAAVVGVTTLVGAPAHTASAAGLTTCPVWTPTNLQCNQHTAAGPLGAIGVIGDSVLLGSGDGLSTPGLPSQLAAAGWGPVNFLAAKGYTTGRNKGAGQPNTAAYWINRWRAEGFDPPVMMVNFGNNDMGYCPPLNVACMKQTIDYLLDVIGDQTEVWWPNSAGVDYNRVGPWNTALSLAAQERPNLHVWDWEGEFAAANPPFAHDRYFIHLANGPNYARRSALMAADVTTVFGPSRRVGPNAPVATASGAASDYLPVDIARAITGLHLAAGQTATIDLSASAPADATAVALTLEPRNPVGPGYLTAVPCGAPRPEASNVNFVAGQRRAAQALVTLTAAHTFCLFSWDAADVDIDVQGWFVSGSASRLTGVVPTRLLDTRETGRQRSQRGRRAGRGDRRRREHGRAEQHGRCGVHRVGLRCTAARPRPDPLRPGRDHRRRGLRQDLGGGHDLRHHLGAGRRGRRSHRGVLRRRAVALHTDGGAADGRHT